MIWFILSAHGAILVIQVRDGSVQLHDCFGYSWYIMWMNMVSSFSFTTWFFLFQALTTRNLQQQTHLCRFWSLCLQVLMYICWRSWRQRYQLRWVIVHKRKSVLSLIAICFHNFSYSTVLSWSFWYFQMPLCHKRLSRYVMLCHFFEIYKTYVLWQDGSLIESSSVFGIYIEKLFWEGEQKAKESEVDQPVSSR